MHFFCNLLRKFAFFSMILWQKKGFFYDLLTKFAYFTWFLTKFAFFFLMILWWNLYLSLDPLAKVVFFLWFFWWNSHLAHNLLENQHFFLDLFTQLKSLLWSFQKNLAFFSDPTMKLIFSSIFWIVFLYFLQSFTKIWKFSVILWWNLHSFVIVWQNLFFFCNLQANYLFHNPLPKLGFIHSLEEICDFSAIPFWNFFFPKDLWMKFTFIPWFVNETCIFFFYDPFTKLVFLCDLLTEFAFLTWSFGLFTQSFHGSSLLFTCSFGGIQYPYRLQLRHEHLPEHDIQTEHLGNGLSLKSNRIPPVFLTTSGEWKLIFHFLVMFIQTVAYEWCLMWCKYT